MQDGFRNSGRWRNAQFFRIAVWRQNDTYSGFADIDGDQAYKNLADYFQLDCRSWKIMAEFGANDHAEENPGGQVFSFINRNSNCKNGTPPDPGDNPWIQVNQIEGLQRSQ